MSRNHASVGRNISSTTLEMTKMKLMHENNHKNKNDSLSETYIGILALQFLKSFPF